MPRLRRLACECDLSLVFKLHPFESVKGQNRLLRKLLSPSEMDNITVLAGPATEELWDKIRFGMAAESTIALECTARGIPIFLCSWLQSPHASYVSQYARFGVGQLLDSPEQMDEIPSRLREHRPAADMFEIWQQMNPQDFRALLRGTSERQARGLA